MIRKHFQDATVKHVLAQLRNRARSGRFLVADEVGLGKTLVAQGVIEGLCRPGRTINVFYVCSSLSIARQNRDNLLDQLPPAQRDDAWVHVDRVTLAPTRPPKNKGLFNLFTLTPGTMPGKNRQGRVDERALVLYILLRALPSLRPQRGILRWLRHHVDRGSWRAARRAVSARMRYQHIGKLVRSFRRFLAQELGLSPHAWADSIVRTLVEQIASNPAGAIQVARTALAHAAVQTLRPDLIVLDEFQRFFDLLLPEEQHDDDDDVDRTADRLMRDLLRSRGGTRATPSVLLLSATPYPLFSDWAQGGPAKHFDQLFKTLGFLYGRVDHPILTALREDFREYGRLLEKAEIGSQDVQNVKRRIEHQLSQVMVRTERSSGNDLPEREVVNDSWPADLRPLDIQVFGHLTRAARESHPGMVEGIYSSIPYPLQMMDDASYVLRRDARPEPLAGEDRAIEIRFPAVRRYRGLSHPHPKLRALLADVPPSFLALPWLPPTRPWWTLDGIFANRGDGANSGRPGKALLFSRFRAVPRAISALLSYEAERYAFGADRGRSATHYDYRARRRSSAEGGRQSIAGLRPQPRASFDFPPAHSREEGYRLLPMFLPMPTLAEIGNPLRLKGFAAGRLTLDTALAQIREELLALFKGTAPRKSSRPVWRWALNAERSRPTWRNAQEGWTLWARRAYRAHGSAARTLYDFVEEERYPADLRPSSDEIAELASLALLAPGNVLYRAVSRVFGYALSTERIAQLTDLSLGALRGYLDTPEFHIVLSGSRRLRHPEAIRTAVWDGNLESVLDEYLVLQQGLGVDQPPAGREQRATESLRSALSIRTSTIQVRGIVSRKRSFRLRCHAALPFGLGREDVVFGTGRASGEKVRGDFLRVAFNSPFRPFVLATTSIGQEGLDFHAYCDRVIHWDLPSNPVAIEQREGRVRRYGSLAVRRQLAARFGRVDSGRDSPWRAIAKAAATATRGDGTNGGMSPWWVCPGATVLRRVYVPTLSRIDADLARLLDALALYRLAMGQPDQEQLVRALRRRLEEAGSQQNRLKDWLRGATINLSPFWNKQLSAFDK
jgi:hypothetical protein